MFSFCCKELTREDSSLETSEKHDAAIDSHSAKCSNLFTSNMQPVMTRNTTKDKCNILQPECVTKFKYLLQE